MKKKESILGMAFFGPALVLLILFLFLPMVLTLVFSFTDYFALNPEETLMVGDREIDILSGKNAGVYTCLYMEGNPGALNTKADYTVENMAAFQALFLES